MEETYEQSRRKIVVPVWEKSCLTLEEAAAYSGIGIHKLREISNDKRCEFVLFIGTKRLIKRKRGCGQKLGPRMTGQGVSSHVFT